MLKQTAICCTAGEVVAEALDDGHEEQQHHDTHVYNILMVQVLPVVNGKAADAAGAHGTGHGGQADQADGRNGNDTNDIRHGLMEIDAETAEIRKELELKYGEWERLAEEINEI